jgi:hypothetical protein
VKSNLSVRAKVPLEGVGTKATGFVEKEYGPFRCGHCVWFAFAKDSGRCHHPKVIADPEVKKSDGLAVVGQDDCCNLFRPTRKLDQVKFSDVGL